MSGNVTDWSRSCNCPVPKDCDAPLCGAGPYQSCKKMRGHPGVHGNAPSSCSRPLGHEGDHMVVTEHAAQLARWPR